MLDKLERLLCLPPSSSGHAPQEFGPHPHHRASGVPAAPPGLRRPAAHHAVAHLGHHTGSALQPDPRVSPAQTPEP